MNFNNFTRELLAKRDLRIEGRDDLGLEELDKLENKPIVELLVFALVEAAMQLNDILRYHFYC